MAWTVYSLAADFTTTNNSAQQPTGLLFTPSANTRYWVKLVGLVRTSLISAAPWIGATWPTAGIDFSVGRLRLPIGVGTYPNERLWGPATGGATNATGLSPINTSFTAVGEFVLNMGASPTGDFEITLRVESGATATVSLMAGSALWVWEY